MMLTSKKLNLNNLHQQLALLSRLSNEVLARRAERRSDPESLKLCEALLEHNPEVYTAWNWRREVVGPLLEEPSTSSTSSSSPLFRFHYEKKETGSRNTFTKRPK